MDATRFRDRAEAGRVLAEHLKQYAGRDDVVVLALPRGGVPVAYEVATALRAPLDVFPVRKLEAEGYEELAIGAVAPGGVLVLDEGLVRTLGLAAHDLGGAIRRELEELERCERLYRAGRGPPTLTGKTVLLVDDGLATGSTMRAAADGVRPSDPARIVVAVPVAAPRTCDELRHVVDEIVCLATPEPFRAVGLWYEDFSQTSDDEVCERLVRAWHAAGE